MRHVADLAWFKNARIRVTRGASARALIGPALKWVYERESLVAVPGLQVVGWVERCRPPIFGCLAAASDAGHSPRRVAARPTLWQASAPASARPEMHAWHRDLTDIHLTSEKRPDPSGEAGRARSWRARAQNRSIFESFNCKLDKGFAARIPRIPEWVH